MPGDPENLPLEHWDDESAQFGLEGTEIELLAPLEYMYRPRMRTLLMAEVTQYPDFMPKCVEWGLEVKQDPVLGKVFVVSRTGVFPEFLMAFNQDERERPC